MPECPHCKNDLAHKDTFGRFARHRDGAKCGEIYKCERDECEAYGAHFHTCVGSDNLREGYPC